jgi:serine/threonine protein kinase
MVMPLLEGAEALGKAPSFSTVTRDAGPTDSAQEMSKEQVLSVVWNVASALEHVHRTANVVNGDVYLHNILQCGEGVAKISDWGASFVYDGQDPKMRRSFEAIEVLAFGRLVQDLFEWHLGTALPDATEPSDFLLGRSRGTSLVAGPFYDLMSSVLQPQQDKRPSFGEIMAVLSSIPEFGAAKQLTGHSQS